MRLTVVALALPALCGSCVDTQRAYHPLRLQGTSRGDGGELLRPVLPDDFERADALDPSITQDFTPAGTLRHARSLVPAIGNPMDRESALGRIAVVAARAGDVEGAIADVERIEEKSSRTEAFQELVDSLYLRDRNAALAVLRRWEELDARLPPEFRAELMALDGRLDEARATLREPFVVVDLVGTEMLSFVNPEAFLARIVMRQLEVGDFDRARETLAAIRNDVVADGARYAVARSLARGGDLEAGAEAVKEVDNPLLRAEALLELARAHGAAGDADRAQVLIARAEELVPREDPDWAERLIAVRADCGDLAGAREAVRPVTDRGDRVDALCALAEAEYRAGESEEAARRIDQALELAARLDDPYYELHAVVHAMSRCGQYDRALELNARLERPAGDPWSTVGVIAERQAGAGDFEGAVATLDRIPTSERPTWNRANAARALGEELGASGRADRMAGFLGDRPLLLERVCALVGYAQAILESREIPRR